MTQNIYSIGHGHKTASEFINELRSFGIQYLIDVRSSPFSKWAPHFNKGSIEFLLKDCDIRYVYMGDTIGGRPQSPDCYDENGYFDYKKMAMVPTFITGLKRLVNANEGGYKIAVMCSESDPAMCHRSKLIGRELFFGHHIVMQHITAPEKCTSEIDLLEQLTKGHWTINPMFEELNEPPFFKSRNAYKDNQENEEEHD